MIGDETRKKLQDIVTGALLQRLEDHCTTIRNLLCESFKTGPTIKSEFESQSILKKEQCLFLKSHAEKEGLWRTSLPPGSEYLTRGGESQVFLAADNRHVIKLNDAIYYASWGEYFNSLVIHNLLFPNTAYSSGGLLGMYALLSQPDLFQAYILSDPALWWDNGYLTKYAQDKWDTGTCKNKSVYISGREGEPYVQMGIRDMETVLATKAPSGLHWKCMAYPAETHSSVILKTAYDGLKWTYSGYSAKEIVFHPMNGIIVKEEPFKLWCRIDVPVVCYTTNGTVPTAQSTRMQSFNSIVNPSRLVIKDLCVRVKYDQVATGDFTAREPLTPVQQQKKLKAGGFRYDYYEGDWDKLPDLSQLKPVRSGIMDKGFDMDKLPARGHFALLVKGFLEVLKDGYYVLALDKDDDLGDSKQYTRLSLGSEVLFDYDCLDGSCKEQSFIVPLKKGFYPFHLEYFYKAGVRNMQLVYVQPGINDSAPDPL